MLIDSQNIWHLYLEGAAEDMMNNILRKNNVPQELHDLFLTKENNKLVFKTDDVPLLYKWIQNENANTRTLKDDYKNYQKFFGNTPLTNFTSYLDFTEKVHAKRDEADYLNRHKNVGNIELEGSDKENIIENNDEILILKGDDEHKCVKYGKGYSFCISRGGGGNMYGNYRLSKASTFYFIFFKNIPKEDERHIMVLDRTDSGWEWTFGKNQTKVVQGGWDEIVAQFPILAKYEDKFVNKPLTPEEEEYQNKLQKFVYNPSMEIFNKFSYKEKADVLKFGMSIPLDVFESLDKYLKNEWISVGPKISIDIYNILTDKEKERFVTVRKQQLNQILEDIYEFSDLINDDNISEVDFQILSNDEYFSEQFIKPFYEDLEKVKNNYIKNKEQYYITDYYYDNIHRKNDAFAKKAVEYFIKNKIFMPFMVTTKYTDSFGIKYPEEYKKAIEIASRDVKFGALFIEEIANAYARYDEDYPLPLEISKNLINEKDPIKYIGYISHILIRSYSTELHPNNIAFETLLKHLTKIIPSIHSEIIKIGNVEIKFSNVLINILSAVFLYNIVSDTTIISLFNSIPDKFKNEVISKLDKYRVDHPVFKEIKKRLGIESLDTQELNDSIIYDLVKSFLLKS